MNLSMVRTYSEELKSSIEKLIHSHKGEREAKELIHNMAIYILANNLDVKSYLFDEQYAHLGDPKLKMKQIINSTVDYLFLILNHRDFGGLSLGGMEDSLKVEIYNYLRDKINQNALNADNFQDFIHYLQSTYDADVLLDIIRIRIKENPEKKEEFKALLEYMTFSGKNFIEDDDLERIQDAINFRMNLLKNYNIEYFSRNFFILKNHVTLFPDEYQTCKYFNPAKLLKDLKNLVLNLERGKTHSIHVQNEAKNIVHRQYSLLKRNEVDLSKLKKN